VREFIKTRLRRALVGIPLCVALMAMMVSVSGCQALFKQQPAKPAGKESSRPKPRVPSGAERFASATTSLTASLEIASKAIKSGKRDKLALGAIASFKEQLPRLDAGVRADFAKTRTVLKKVKSAEKDAIEARVERQYAEREARLAALLGEVTSAGSDKELSSALAQTAKFLDSVTPEEPYQPLGTQLPHRIVNAHAGPPVLGTSIAPAYAPNTPGAEPSTLPITPTAEDTSETIEVQFTDDIRSLATSLGNDPVRMYEYVSNTIDFEPYYGSRKGAEETLLEGSGNDMDTASLLIALYRASGIPARYVSGVVDVPIAKAMNWVGVETPEAAAKLFASGGTPTITMLSGGKPKALRVEHTWAEVYVSYEDYRGAGAGKGPKLWVPLDASFKEYDDGTTGGINLNDYRNSLDQFSSLLSEMALDDNGVSTRSPTFQEPLRALASEVASASRDVLLVEREMIYADNSKVLPNKEPWVPIAVKGETSALLDSTRESVTIQLRDVATGTCLLSAHAPAVLLAQKTVCIEYRAEGVGDATLLNCATALSDVAAYEVRVVPVLKADGVILARGGGVLLGQEVQLEVFRAATSERLGELVTCAGGSVGLVCDLGRIAPRSIATGSSTGAVALEQLLDGDESSTVAATAIGSLLATCGRMYFFDADSETKAIARNMEVAWFRDLSYCSVAAELRANKVLGVPFSLRDSGVSIDVDSLDALLACPEEARFGAFHTLSGLLASGLEGTVLTSILGGISPGVSTASVFSEAWRTGVALKTLDSSAPDAVEELDLPEIVRSSIRAQLSSGRQVLVPEKEVSLAGWTGVGWLVVDPETHSQGFMISGERAGGWTWVLEPAIFATLGVAVGCNPNAAGRWGAGMVITIASIASTMKSVSDVSNQLEETGRLVADSHWDTKEYNVLRDEVTTYTSQSVATSVLFMFMQYGSSTVPITKVAPNASTIVAIGAFLQACLTAYYSVVIDLEIECVRQEYLAHKRIRY
jgi:transglutaminase-like putative cysteine protease